MILIAAATLRKDNKSQFSLGTQSMKIREENPKEIVKTSICGVIVGMLFKIIFAIVGIVGIFRNIEKESEYIWMLVVLSVTYILFIFYFIQLLLDLRMILAELEQQQQESVYMNQYAFDSSMNIIYAITNTEKYNPFKLLNTQFYIIILILSAELINSNMVIGQFLAIVNYIIAAIIILYISRTCWLCCCKKKFVTKKPNRYSYQSCLSPNYVQKIAFLFGILMLLYYVLKCGLYIIFLLIQNEDYRFTFLASLFYSFIICIQIIYVLYLIKQIDISLYSEKYFKCYMTLFQSLYLSNTIQNNILKGLYFSSILCTYIAFFIEKPYKKITKDTLFGILQFCSYEHFIYFFTILQLIYFFFLKSYCVNEEEEQLQVFEFIQTQPQEQRLQSIHNNQDYSMGKQKQKNNFYQIDDLDALQEIYDNKQFQQLELKMKLKSDKQISLVQWIEDKKKKCQQEGKNVDQDYFINLKQFIEQNVRQKKDNKEQLKQDQELMNCAICKKSLGQKDIIQLECNVKHRFHTECITKQTHAVHKCPLCNQST
ncbi:unnamed protein product [Paramecium sonneborni]|uniref:RING-type domain-containing protein n=1 Tax=Paramecium sonneborni TaxID=65129 RepID=A0A8S1QE88_9CILI|nr:unnamed protein product [Paramecium sonneborni]